MRIVDKYELAECGPGTPFFWLSNYRKDTYYMDYPMQMLTSSAFTDSEGNTMFNGVTYLTLDNDNWQEDLGGIIGFSADCLPSKIKFVVTDDDSNVFTDDDRFLVLNAKEFRDILDKLEECYLELKQFEESQGDK